MVHMEGNNTFRIRLYVWDCWVLRWLMSHFRFNLDVVKFKGICRLHQICCNVKNKGEELLYDETVLFLYKLPRFLAII